MCSRIPQDCTRQVECLQWTTKELASFVTLDSVNATWQAEILQFLFLHSFFQVTKDNPNIPHVRFTALAITLALTVNV